MTRQELQQDIQQRLQGRAHAEQDARQLVAYACGCRIEDLITHPETRVTRMQRWRASRATAQRLRHRPLAYITGRQPFLGRWFFVNRYTLIPRPETEELVTLACALAEPESRIIELGTGSGVIALSVAASTGYPVLATDIARGALRMASRNARALNLQQHITLLHGSLLSPIADNQLGDTHLLLLANLPYLTEREWQQAPTQPFTNELTHEPKSALVSDTDDGIGLYRELFTQLKRRRATLPPRVTLLLEMNPDQTTPCASAFHALFPDAEVETKHDLSGRARFLHIELTK